MSQQLPDSVGAPSVDAPEAFDVHIDAFLCPITQDYMRDPVITSDGQTYERRAIEAWLQRCAAQGMPPTSPLTGEALGGETLIPNVILRGLIRELLEKRPELLTAGQTGAAFANL